MDLTLVFQALYWKYNKTIKKTNISNPIASKVWNCTNFTNFTNSPKVFGAGVGLSSKTSGELVKLVILVQFHTFIGTGLEILVFSMVLIWIWHWSFKPWIENNGCPLVLWILMCKSLLTYGKTNIFNYISCPIILQPCSPYPFWDPSEDFCLYSSLEVYEISQEIDLELHRGLLLIFFTRSVWNQ